MATTSNKGFVEHTQASGAAIANVFGSLLSDLDALFRGRETETHTLAAAGKAELVSGHRAANLVVTVVNETDNTAALVHQGGAGDAVSILAQSGATYTTTEGGAGTTNIYWDAGNTQYEIENNLADGEKTYSVTAEGAE